MSGKGSVSRMSDECLMKGKPWLPYFGEYQAGIRKFTLALESGLRCDVDHDYDFASNICNHPTPIATVLNPSIYWGL